MSTSPPDPDELVAHVAATAAHEAAVDVANQLVGLLWHHQQAADTEEAEALRVERQSVLARKRTLRPGGEDVDAALAEWGARVRALRGR